MRSVAVASLACVLAALPAMADEVWESPELGTVVYLEDLGDTAVFSYYDGAGFLFVPGLPGSMDGRGTYDGYWIETFGEPLCEASLVGPNGTSSSAWGRMVLTFDSTSFPTGFTAIVGSCFDEPSAPISGASTALEAEKAPAK